MKTLELTGGVLDYWVTQTAGGDGVLDGGVCVIQHPDDPHDVIQFAPSSKWEHGGPLLEEYAITVTCIAANTFHARELLTQQKSGAVGTTYLEAAMRCLVRSAYGDEVPCQTH